MRGEANARKKIIETLKDLWDRGHMNTTGVSISIRLEDNRILVDQTGTGFRRAQVTEGDLLLIDLDGNLIEPAPNSPEKRAPVNTVVHLAYYRENLKARACIHVHAPYSQVFACRGESIEPYILQSEILGIVPCIQVDDRKLKEKFFSENLRVAVPTGLHARPDVYYVMREVADITAASLRPRNDEMDKHGLAVTHYQHGIFVFGRNIDESFDNLERVEANARTIILSRMMDRK
jgi:ribulose-5-phosphate 4-epimerase/fuculose-1-phosphate aldolase